jgi:hypothetical protein
MRNLDPEENRAEKGSLGSSRTISPDCKKASWLCSKVTVPRDSRHIKKSELSSREM